MGVSDKPDVRRFFQHKCGTSGQLGMARADGESEQAVRRNPSTAIRSDNMRIEQSEGSAARLRPIALDMRANFGRTAAFFIGAGSVDECRIGKASKIAVCIAFAISGG